MKKCNEMVQRIFKKYPIAFVGVIVVLVFLLIYIIFFKMNSGKNYVIKFDANSTTGYFWNYELSDESIVEVVKDSYEENAVDEDIVGVGGTQTYEIKGLKKGEVTILFTYQQVGSGDIGDEKKVTLVIDSNLNVKEKTE